MSELRSALDALRTEVLAELPDARVEEDFIDLHRAIEQLEVERLRRLAEIERRRLYARDGHLSVASWLVATLRVSWGSARGESRVARALDDMLITRRALEAGDVSLPAARVLVEARRDDPVAFERSESQLVDAARLHTIGELQRAVAHWRARLARERSLDGDDELRSRRRLHASPTFLGMVRIDGDLDPETGETLLTALGAVLDAEARGSAAGDDRTPAQRRADALGEVCRQWLDLAARPSVASERPHVNVIVDVPALRGGIDGNSELDLAGPIGPEVARRLACDASIARVVMAGRSEPLDVGRRTPVVSPSMRRAVVARDRHCRFPGCDRPHRWCDAHHVVHWADGGRTAASNLLLLCRRHHRAVHERGGFRLEQVDGGPIFRRPDGSILEGRAPPRSAA